MIRQARPEDLEALVLLCAEHAAFERAPYVSAGKAERLREALFCDRPRLHAWVATGPDGAVIGYATATVDFATWSAAAFLSMDCLFVRACHRNGGVGAALLEAVAHHGRERGLTELQWQTPVWNTDACRFYRRQGASALDKTRFSLKLG